MTSDSEEPTTRKRPRTSATGESKHSKKQRGRPKVDTQDETAADRRRTQIRLAQRAYRQRKETTISSLQKQVEQLQSIIGSMNSSFLNFNDRVLQSDILSLRPQLASELKETTEKFVSLTRSAKLMSAEDDEYTSESPVSASVPSQNSQNSSLPATLSSRDYNDVMQIDPSPSQAQQPPGTHMGLGYWRTFDDTEGTGQVQGGLDNSFFSGFEIPQFTSTSTMLASMDNTITDPSQFNALNFTAYPYRNVSGPGGDSTMTATTQAHTSTVPTFDNSGNFSLDSQQQQPEDSPNASNNALIASSYPSSPIFRPIPFFSGTLKTPTISAPFTYSFQETTFARRLQRACIERGFHLLSGADLRPSAYSRVFRLCRHYSTRDELLAQFKLLLQQSVMDPLEFLKSPFLHLGGAGTHYPSRRSDGTIAPIRNTQNKDSPDGSKTIRRVGPYATKAQLARALSGSGDPDHWAPLLEEDLRNYEGEWFDSQDVEGYLAEMGVYINPQASFAEATITQMLDVVAKGAHPDSEASLEMENLLSLREGVVNHLPSGGSQSSPNSSGGRGRGGYIDPEASRDAYMGATSGGGSGSGATTPSQVLTAPSPAGQSSGSGDVSAGVPTTPSTAQMQMQNAMLDSFSAAMFSSNANNGGGGVIGAGGTAGALADMALSNYDLDSWAQRYGLHIGSFSDGLGGGAGAGGGLGFEGTRLRRTVTVDVQRLVNGLIKRSVCIGRGPGFRREDVDYALKQAVIEAF